MADDKTQNRIGKRDVKPLDGRYRRSASTRELCKAAGSRPGPGAPLGNRNSLVHGIYADRFMSAEERPLFEIIISFQGARNNGWLSPERWSPTPNWCWRMSPHRKDRNVKCS